MSLTSHQWSDVVKPRFRKEAGSDPYPYPEMPGVGREIRVSPALASMSCRDGSDTTPISTHFLRALLLISFLSGAALAVLAADCVSFATLLGIQPWDSFAPVLAGVSAALLWFSLAGVCCGGRPCAAVALALLSASVLVGVLPTSPDRVGISVLLLLLYSRCRSKNVRGP